MVPLTKNTPDKKHPGQKSPRTKSTPDKKGWRVVPRTIDYPDSGPDAPTTAQVTTAKADNCPGDNCPGRQLPRQDNCPGKTTAQVRQTVQNCPGVDSLSGGTPLKRKVFQYFFFEVGFWP